MPSSVVKAVADKTDLSVSELEDLWDEAKAKAEDEGYKDNYKYIMSIFKNLIGKDNKKKMGWESYSPTLFGEILKQYKGDQNG